MADSDRLERFAELVVRVGANVQPGSGVLLGSDIAHVEIARAVVEHADAAGASWVEVEWSDGPIRRSRLSHASMETLTTSGGVCRGRLNRAGLWSVTVREEWFAAAPGYCDQRPCRTRNKADLADGLLTTDLDNPRCGRTRPPPPCEQANPTPTD